jgi:hypothetical protein
MKTIFRMMDRLCVITMLLMLLIGILGTMKTANANPTNPLLEVKPTSYITNQLETFDIEVWLCNITEDKRLIAVQFDLTFNSTLLQVQNVAEGPFMAKFNQTSTPPYTFFMYSLNPNNVTVGVVIVPNTDPSQPPYTRFPEGNGLLATITFKGISMGPLNTQDNCTLELENILLLNDSTPPEPITYDQPKDGCYRIINKPLQGDVNRDGKVDVRDITVAVGAFGSYGPDGRDFKYPGRPPHPRWNPKADITNRTSTPPNNCVDVWDISLVAKNFGKSIYP